MFYVEYIRNVHKYERRAYKVMKKKIVLVLIGGIVLTSLTACDFSGVMSQIGEELSKMEEENEDSDEETTAGDVEGDDATQGDDGLKIEDSKTLRLYEDIICGTYTMKTELYAKFTEEKTVSQTTFTVTNGEKTYMEFESVNAEGELEVISRKLIMDGYLYNYYDDMKFIMKSKYKKDNTNISLFGDDIRLYYDVLGEPETVEVFGESFYCERFAGYGYSIGYCYDGDTLKYILSKEGGVEFISGVIQLEQRADESYFELPEDYEVSGQ